MEKHLEDLIRVSRYYGNNPEYIVAGGGNTSFKSGTKIWVKASGTSLGDIDEEGFVCLDRERLQVLLSKEYSNAPAEREEAVKTDLEKAVLYPMGKRPSVETSMHEVISFPYVVHTHPALINGLLCAQDSARLVSELFSDDEVIYIEYTDPGYVLFRRVHEALLDFRKLKGKEPNIIFLENHGVFVGAESVNEVIEIYNRLENKLLPFVAPPPADSLGVDCQYVPEEMEDLQFMFVEEKVPFLTCFDATPFVLWFVKDMEHFNLISRPFTPDNIVYCKSAYLFLGKGKNLPEEVKSFQKQHGYLPRVIGIEGRGILTIEEDVKSAVTVLKVFRDMMKVAWYTLGFGGPRPMTPAQIEFIDSWEVENYRRQVSKRK